MDHVWMKVMMASGNYGYYPFHNKKTKVSFLSNYM